MTAQTDKLAGLIEQAQHAGWYLPHANICWMAERPCALHRDDRGRLHNPDGLAIEYPDGWGVYAVHGVRVPGSVIQRQYQAESITAEPNAEIRRVMLELYGTARYIQDIHALPVHTDDWGTLYKAPVGDDEPLCMVRVVNGTPEPDGSYHDYWLRVPPTMRTALEAVAWTYDQKPEVYRTLSLRT